MTKPADNNAKQETGSVTSSVGTNPGPLPQDKVALYLNEPEFFVKYTTEEREQLRRLCDTWIARVSFYPRLVYDMSLCRFLQYFAFHATPPLLSESEDALRRDIAESLWPQHPERVIVTLSIRTFFHLLLTALDLPKGSEVLFSGLSIPQMSRIAEYHGLVLRAFDIDLISMRADIDQARSLVSDKTRLMIIAPVYGTHIDGARELRRIASDRNIPIFLDLAQSWGVMHLYRDLDADFTAMSFGSIKLQTSLGGCVATVKNDALRQRIVALEQALPTRTWASQLGVMIKNGSAMMLTNDALSAAQVVNFVNLLGYDWLDMVNALSRGFPGPNLIELIRRRPHRTLLKMMAYRFKHESHDAKRTQSKLRLRAMSGWDILSRLPSYVQIVGAGDPNEPLNSTFWLFPMYCRDPIGANHVLHANGIDSALGTSQMCSMGAGVDRHVSDNSPTASLKGSTTPMCDHFIRHILYLPAYPQVGETGRERLLKVLHAMPQSMIESPSEKFHAYVAHHPRRHAYRSAAVDALLKDRPRFREDFPRLFVGAGLAAAAVPAGFALKSML